MTDEQIRLYAIARVVIPAGTRLRTLGEPAAGGTLYTLVLEEGDQLRWFAVHSNILSDSKVPDRVIASEIRYALERRPASPAQAA